MIALVTLRIEAQNPPMTVTAIGHEYRQDDLPAIAAAPDGSLWAAWLSFAGDRDDIAIRRYRNQKWESLQWVPGTSGDSWLPQVAVDSAGRVWVVWSQQVDGNWDLYARRFDPGRQQWDGLARLTSDAGPDINPRLAADGAGHFGVVWQGFREGRSNIFFKALDGEKWLGDVRVTNQAANDWEPAVAFEKSGAGWVVYDSYRNGNYDVFARKVTRDAVQGDELPVAVTPRFEARATVAVDALDRVWIAWESGAANWGKDTGFWIRKTEPGVVLGGERAARIRCYANGRWMEPEASVAGVFPGNAFQPHVFSDDVGSVWLAAKLAPRSGPRPAGYFEYWITHLEGDHWSAAFAVPESKGRLSTRIGATHAADGALWLAWPSDGRTAKMYHRPVRQRVYAGSIAARGNVRVALRPAVADSVEAKVGHSDEAGDVRAIRAYVADIGGRRLHILRGDFHRHTELSWDEGGFQDGSLQDLYRYMIDAAGMDFGASTDHQGGLFAYWWWYSQKMTDMYYAPGGYVPIFGYERSSMWPDGHRNLFFARRSEARITPLFVKTGAKDFTLPAGRLGDEPDISEGVNAENDTKLLYEEIRPLGGLSIPHTPGNGAMGTDWRDNDPNLEPVVEIFQGDRTSYEQMDAPLVGAVDAQPIAPLNPKGMLSSAWAKGYLLGVIASSDHLSTHLSYAMVYTADRSRQGILDAIHRRHTYGAMDNIILDVRMGDHFMGDEFPLKAAQPIRIKARGTRAIARVEVIRDSRVIYSAAPGQQEVALTFADQDARKGRHYYYVRIEQEDRMLAWSSPFFVEYE